MSKLQSLLEQAGVLLNGDRPWDVQVHDERAYRRILRDGFLGVGETYMDGWWDCEQLDELMNRVLGIELVHYYDERFFCMWKFYLLSCAGSFRARRNQLWQLVFSKNGLPHGYVAPC